MKFEVDPKQKLAELAKLLKEEAPKAVNRQVTKALGEIVAPLKREVTTNTGNYLPRAGGLATRASRSKLRHRIGRGKRPGVTITAPRDPQTFRDPARVDRGRIAHPVFGMAHSRNPWQVQDVIPGWFTKPLQESAPITQRALVEAIDDAITEIKKQV